MSPQFFVVLLVLTIVCMAFARGMAVQRGRSPRLWMWLAAFFGPVPLAVLAVLRDRRN